MEHLITQYGYLFGQTLEVFLGDARRYERWAFAALALIGVAAWGVYRLRGRSCRRT